MMRIIIALVVAGALIAGCSSGSSQENEQVKGTIMTYNRLLAEGYASLNMSGLARVAAAEQAAKVYHHMAALGEARTKVVSELKDIQFRNLKFTNVSTAAVETREIWDFRHVNIDNGTVTLDEKNFPYLLDYRLRKRSGKWLVLSVAARENATAKEK